MVKLTELDKKDIAQAIQEAEKKTSGEIVTVLARRSGRYIGTSLTAAAMCALLLPLLYVFIFSPYLMDGSLYLIFGFQIITFMGVFHLFDETLLSVKFTPKSFQKYRAQNKAHAQFYKQGLHLTKDRAAIMLFVSFAERYVEIIADEGINKKVKQKTWDNLIGDFTQKIHARRVKEAFLSSIQKSEKLLIKHYPAKRKNPNELTNLLIEI